eukprot:TRINITY_DN16475_c0_g1_i1.p1 TRINITY_DN16475_c0_g1~~TRINITY_DN16475_c0_g1_i1.p1  ORF type:complete len:240 (+),score=17.75 TRINITY_DN16475_c0_g1_i1:63-722(+)
MSGLLIFVRLPTGEKLPMELEPSATTGDIFRGLAETHPDLPRMRLCFQGEDLPLDAELADAGVCSEAVVEMDFIRNLVRCIRVTALDTIGFPGVRQVLVEPAASTGLSAEDVEKIIGGSTVTNSGTHVLSRESYVKGSSQRAWYAKNGAPGHWIEVDFGRPIQVGAVGFLGCMYSKSWRLELWGARRDVDPIETHVVGGGSTIDVVVSFDSEGADGVVR